jgi:hypothetical protein
LIEEVVVAWSKKEQQYESVAVYPGIKQEVSDIATPRIQRGLLNVDQLDVDVSEHRRLSELFFSG